MSAESSGSPRQSRPATPDELLKLHESAEAMMIPFSYQKPEGVKAGKGSVRLGRTPVLKALVQIVKKNGGENNLHYHSNGDSFWMILKGRARFYGPDDVLNGEFGPMEGTFTPSYARYWFENAGDGDLEILHVTGFLNSKQESSGRTDVEAQRYKVGSSDRFDGRLKQG